MCVSTRDSDADTVKSLKKVFYLVASLVDAMSGHWLGSSPTLSTTDSTWNALIA